MKEQLLGDTAKAMMADDKGLLAMDESTATCHKRFAKLAIPQRSALGTGVFLCPHHPATGFGDLARRGSQPLGGAASAV